MNEKINDTFKSVASVADVARIVGLSRERFYQLQREGVFPMPLYDLATRRPFYSEEMQRACTEVRRRNCGINGKPVLFYSKGMRTPTSKPTKKTAKSRSRPEACTGPSPSSLNWLIEGVEGLGCETTEVRVAAVVKAMYPQGLPASESEHGVVIGKVLREIMRQNRADNVGR